MRFLISEVTNKDSCKTRSRLKTVLSVKSFKARNRTIFFSTFFFALQLLKVKRIKLIFTVNIWTWKNLTNTIIILCANHLNECGYFLESSTAAMKSDTISAQTRPGSEQSGLAGHHSLCFLDCRMPLGSRIRRTNRTPKLQREQMHF